MYGGSNYRKFTEYHHFCYVQVADLVSNHILDTITRIVNFKQTGLYKEDRLIFIPQNNGPITAKIHEEIIRGFKYITSTLPWSLFYAFRLTEIFKRTNSILVFRQVIFLLLSLLNFTSCTPLTV